MKFLSFILFYLNPYNSTLTAALTLQDRAGINPRLGDNPYASKNMAQIAMIA